MSNGEPINTILKVVIISLSTLFGSLFATSTYSKYKTNKKRLLANESKKEAIEKSLVKEKEKLEELNKIQKPIESEDNITSTKVEYLNKLKVLRNILEIYYQCGYNKNKYERYLQNGILEKKLSRYYTLEEIKLIREYLEEKKSTQVKETECKLKLCK